MKENIIEKVLDKLSGDDPIIIKFYRKKHPNSFKMGTLSNPFIIKERIIVNFQSLCKGDVWIEVIQ